MSNHWKYWTQAGEEKEWPMAANGIGGIPLPAGADLFKVEFLNQFVDAVNERIDLRQAVVFSWPRDENIKMDQVKKGDDIKNFVNSMVFYMSYFTALDEDDTGNKQGWAWTGTPGEIPFFSGNDAGDKYLLTSSIFQQYANAKYGADEFIPYAFLTFRHTKDFASYLFSPGSSLNYPSGTIIASYIFEDWRAFFSLTHVSVVIAITGFAGDGAETYQSLRYIRSDGSVIYNFPWTNYSNYSSYGMNYRAQKFKYGNGIYIKKNLWRSAICRQYIAKTQRSYSYEIWAKPVRSGDHYIDQYGLGAEGIWRKIRSGTDAGPGTYNSEYFVGSSEPSDLDGTDPDPGLSQEAPIYGQKLICEFERYDGCVVFFKTPLVYT